jgi:hypothetical protein
VRLERPSVQTQIRETQHIPARAVAAQQRAYSLGAFGSVL